MARVRLQASDWKTAVTVTEQPARLLQERRAGVRDPLQAARRQDRRRRRATPPATTTIGNVVSRVNGAEGRRDRHLDVVRRAARRSSPGIRTLGNDTPILNSWAGDGTYWCPKSPKVSNYYSVTYASVFGDDPNPARQEADRQRQVKAGDRRLRHRRSRDRRHRRRDQPAKRLDRTARRSRRRWRSSRRCPTISGNVSFSPTLHSVFGRQYRVIEITGNKAKVVGSSRRRSFRSSSRARSWRPSSSRDDAAWLDCPVDRTRAAERPGGTLRAASRLALLRGRAGARRASRSSSHRHEVVGLIGPNGAGKTTLVNVITGFDRADVRARSSSTGATITALEPAPPRRAPGSPARSSTAARSAGSAVRENVEVAALGVGREPARRAHARRRAARAARPRAPTQHAARRRARARRRAAARRRAGARDSAAPSC